VWCCASADCGGGVDGVRAREIKGKLVSSKTDSAGQKQRSASAFEIIWRCFSYLRPYRATTIGVYLMMVLVAVLALLIPQFIRWIIDHGIATNDLNVLGWSIAALMGLALLKGFFEFLQGRWSEVASQGVAYDLRNAIHRKLLSLSFSYHDHAETGQLLSRSLQDVDRVRFLTGRAIMRLAESATMVIGTLIALMTMNTTLALLSLCTMPILAYRAYAFGRVSRPLTLAIQQQIAVLTTRLEQNLRGARVVKSFAQEDAEIARFEVENKRWFDMNADFARLQAINTPMLDLIANIATVIIIWFGGLLTIRGTISLGELVAFSTYMGQLVQPVRRLGTIIPAIAQATSAGERIFEVLDAKISVDDAPNAKDFPPIQGHVRFEDVSLSYVGRRKVLDSINLEAQPGQIIALLGATGSGKSSIINLIPRFYDPTAGRITIDGYDLREMTLQSLREQISIVLQETTLFAESIRENIAFGSPDATDEQVIAAAKAAQAHDFIIGLPQGYQTYVGERGVMLSGGQRQRVAIARALLKNPRILILDDATASVDTQTERQIQQALEVLMQGRTSFVIAQRLSTLRAADLILVLENGKIIARGTHEELLQSSGLYAEIYQYQLRPGAENPQGGE
jgi:ABC-type multidrug transport system fused ATPase/permease subunit